jgi:AbiV family abortive infection protein
MSAGQEQRVPSLLDEIYKNASEVLEAAELLKKNNHNAHSLHFSIICWEECSKYLLAYCKDHLPENQFKSRYNHISKYSLAGAIYFLSGGFSVIHLIQEMYDSGAFGEGSEGLAALVELTLQDVGFGSPERLANSLIKYLSSEKTDDQKAALEKTYLDLEKLRTQSVYVDFNEDLSLQSVPSRVSGGKVDYWIENARLGVGMLSFLRADKPELRNLVVSMPKVFREDVEKQSNEMIAKMRELTGR